MSCLFSRKIYTNSHFLSTVHSKQFVLSVPCGHCVECNKQKKLGYAVRANYEAKDCFKNGGFVVFDTLSYRDSDLPYFHDVFKPALYNCMDRSCFNRNNVRLFFQKLRRRLEYAGYAVRGNLSYFLTSEYGDVEEYVDDYGRVRKGTHRPHHHVLFFVRFKIDPCVFSRFVSQAWKYGRTDGVVYKGVGYFKNKRLFVGDSPHLLSVVRYVSKYVCKDSFYEEVVLCHLKRCFGIAYSSYDNCFSVPFIKKEYDRVKRSVGCFHLESKNFGFALVNDVGVDKLINDGFVYLPSIKSKVFDKVNVPFYYLRKLFYKTIWFNGKRLWVPTELGLKYKVGVYSRSIKNLALKVNSWYDYLRASKSDNFSFVNSVLGGRNGEKLAYYVLCQRGRVNVLGLPADIKGVLFDSLGSSSYNFKQIIDSGCVVYPYNHNIDLCRFRSSGFVADRYLGDSSIWKDLVMVPFHHVEVGVLDSKCFAEKYCYSDSCLELVYEYFSDFQRYYGVMRQNEYEENKYINYKLKNKGILTKSI